MSDTPVFDHDDRVDDVEALLRELDDGDMAFVEPPADLWDGIDQATRDERGADVVPIGGFRARFGRQLLAAAAVAAIAVAGAVVVLSTGGDDVVAETELAFDAESFDPLGADATATAELIERDGGFEIRLADARLPTPADADLELWLISTDAIGEITDVQPVSLVDPGEPGTYAVPGDLDPDVYTVVDISIEPRDGDETHSGRSILRGALDA